MTYVEMCKSGNAQPENWKKWLEENKDTETPKNELLGLLPEEYDDLDKGIRSFEFYAFKKKHTRSIFNLWTGCYVGYLFEYDGNEPHFEAGWVDLVSTSQGLCKIQCDDTYNGNRAVTVRIIDVMEILPHKERPLVYYKTMMCGQCNKCDHSSNEEPKIDCPHYDFMSAILHKQKGDLEFLKLYMDFIGRANNVEQHECECDGHCDGHCDGQCNCEKASEQVDKSDK